MDAYKGGGILHLYSSRGTLQLTLGAHGCVDARTLRQTRTAQQRSPWRRIPGQEWLDRASMIEDEDYKKKMILGSMYYIPINPASLNLSICNPDREQPMPGAIHDVSRCFDRIKRRTELGETALSYAQREYLEVQRSKWQEQKVRLENQII